MMHFGGGQRNEREGGPRSGVFCWRGKRARRLHADTHQEGVGKQNQGDMAIPAPVAAHFIVVEPKLLGGVQVLFDVLAGAAGLDDDGQRRIQGSVDQIIGQFVGVVQAATDHEPVTTVHGASVHEGQACPVKEALAFGAQALREALPVPGMERLLRHAGHITEQEAGAGLHTHGFGRRDGQGVGVALLFQEAAQVRAVAIDRIGDHPADGQVSRLDALDHPLGQFGFGRKGKRVWDVGSAPPRQISAPVFGHIQVAIDQGMAQCRHVGEKDADLAVLAPFRLPHNTGVRRQRSGGRVWESRFRQ